MWLKSFTNIVEHQQNLESRFNQVAANVLWPVLLLSNLQKAMIELLPKWFGIKFSTSTMWQRR